MLDVDHRESDRKGILVGTASWTDKSLLTSGWYPAEATTPAARLAHYASRFPLVEVDATYYSPPSSRTVQAWLARTPPDFTFNVKAFSLLTGHPTPVRTLYKDLRERLGTAKTSVYPRDVPAAVAEEVWARFLGTIRPLHEAGRLGAVLFQFPPWFAPGERARRTVLDAVRRCAPMTACVEFRNAAWMSRDARDATLGFLAEHGVPYVSVDMPQGHPSSIPPVLAATAELAVVRFHGHSRLWASKVIEERFGYLYSEEELARWAGEIADLAARTPRVHVLMNNCCADNAQRNAARLAELLGV
ncbi:hypothetical protein Skr01_41030 [Sphaerisporangium krabiense]|uniref:Uncharacterized protein YecE (DUF72 family) n=1 Tax=Sphaerisporangium krabiense TaxID=763782 RepID=A0A7W9DSN6_9ACTN|nr:DUF72 domain-containing protein [Sphaerisporangium krabiense]MBB5629917.1 uncharacterized protein YecE (DUF72 family) [Sphaerisporangium krabiense]GII64018.1 hypothetical protein Skr01_41030 [Sphaerisporangium krabiense]